MDISFFMDISYFNFSLESYYIILHGNLIQNIIFLWIINYHEKLKKQNIDNRQASYTQNW